MRSYAFDNTGAYQGRPGMGRVLRFVRHTVSLAVAHPLNAGSIGVATKRATVSGLIDNDTLVHLAVIAR